MSHEFYRSDTVKATRKPHRCHLCRLDIPKGTSCQYEVGKFDGDFYAVYSHFECIEYWREMNSHTFYDEEWLPFEEMREVYPHTSLRQWQHKIAKIYDVLDGDGL